MPSQTVLVIGGTGFFGRLLVDDLLHHNDCDLIVASRRSFNATRFRTVVADLSDPHSLDRALSGVGIAICAAGPYQKLPLTFAEMCLGRNIHYIDLADDRVFVQNVRAMAAVHQSSGSVICTGWSTVSALSGLLTRIAAGAMPVLDSIQIQMAPGNRRARQIATIASLMHSVGQPLRVFRNGAWHRVVGWSEYRDFIFPSPIGTRRGYLVDVPDHEIFPEIFRARTVEFRVGSELRFLNGSLSVLRLTRLNWVRWSRVLQAAAGLLGWIGHDTGAIGVEVSGAARRRACIVADSQAERIAVMPASVMTRRLLSGSPLRGLISYTDWLNEEQLRSECERRGWRLVVEES